MPKSSPHAEVFEKQRLPVFAENAYLDYSMYVILDRALPHLADGLKPVQRRIVYAMSELGLLAISKHKKSARTVGDVIGKFHPHGDSACYEAMVLLAQPFSTRYPLVDGQGNFGSVDDPKSFAAMRYTEARLSRYANLLLEELTQGTVDFVPNFDGTLDEPQLLPAKVPMLLLNGAMGIAVGMSTDIPPHNLKEIIDALIVLLKNPNASLDEIMTCLPGPDFPTEAEIITPSSDIQKIYETGNGMLKMRAIYKKEDENIVITALPYQVSPAKVVEQIADQMRAKRLPHVVDLRDESDHENPVRVVVELKSKNIEVESVMSHLCATTDLERSIRVNLNVIGLDGKPRVYSLISFLKEWLTFRVQTTERRLNHRLQKVEARLHLLQGFLIAYLNIDEIIHIVRHEDEPKAELMRRFGLSELQAEAILELKLKQLAKLEEIKIRTESDELSKERQQLKEILESPSKLKQLIQKELKQISADYADNRRSPLVTRTESKALSEAQTVPTEPITVILSQKGWIRAAKGHEIDAASLSYKAGDELLQCLPGKTNQTLALLDTTGRSYSVSAFGLPSARGFGEPLTSQLKPPSGAQFIGCVMVEPDEKQLALLATSSGYGFKTEIDNLFSKNKSGKTLITVPEGSMVLKPLLCNEKAAFVALLTSQSRVLVIPISELPLLPKGKGNKLISLLTGKSSETVIDWVVVPQKTSTLVLHGKKTETLSANVWQKAVGKRAHTGTTLCKGTFTKIEIM